MNLHTEKLLDKEEIARARPISRNKHRQFWIRGFFSAKTNACLYGVIVWSWLIPQRIKSMFFNYFFHSAGPSSSGLLRFKTSFRIWSKMCGCFPKENCPFFLILEPILFKEAQYKNVICYVTTWSSHVWVIEMVTTTSTISLLHMYARYISIMGVQISLTDADDHAYFI